jgi:polyhydroxyalkanoate synthesis repressor PhaR
VDRRRSGARHRQGCLIPELVTTPVEGEVPFPADSPSPPFCDAFRAPQQGSGTLAAMSQERLIKKYANRRLYDASQSRHITLDDIRALIVKGEKIRVLEDKTGQDITRHILLQVIAEQEQFGRPILSTTVLESIIRFYGNSMQGFLASFLEKSVETFLHQQDNLQAQISKIVSATPLATMADLTRTNLEALSKMQESVLSALLPSKREKVRDEDEKRS